MRQNKRNFGNAYHVANSNWQSIHNPITEEEIAVELNGKLRYSFNPIK
jgi:hypothetical protein